MTNNKYNFQWVVHKKNLSINLPSFSFELSKQFFLLNPSTNVFMLFWNSGYVYLLLHKVYLSEWRLLSMLCKCFKMFRIFCAWTSIIYLLLSFFSREPGMKEFLKHLCAWSCFCLMMAILPGTRCGPFTSADPPFLVYRHLHEIHRWCVIGSVTAMLCCPINLYSFRNVYLL